MRKQLPILCISLLAAGAGFLPGDVSADPIDVPMPNGVFDKLGYAEKAFLTPSGRIVGHYGNSQNKKHAFACENGVFADLLPASPTFEASVADVNDAGQAVGQRIDPANKYTACFWGSNNALQTPTFPANTGNSFTRAIADSGQIAGYYKNTNTGKDHVYIWKPGDVMVTSLADNNGGVSDQNASGTVVGSIEDATGEGYASAWVNGAYMSLAPQSAAGPYQDAFESSARLVSDSGVVAGILGLPGTSGYTACAWPDGTLASLVVLCPGSAGAVESDVDAITADGRVLGHFVDASDRYHGFTWKDGVFVDLLPAGSAESMLVAANATGRIAGEYGYGSPARACAWLNGTPASFRSLHPAGAVESHSVGVGLTGRVIGYFEDAGGIDHAFTWQNGVFTDLSPAGSTKSRAMAINNKGQILVYYRDAANIDHVLLLPPMADPPPEATAPKVTISGRKKVVTSKAIVRVRGTATGGATAVALWNGNRVVKVIGTASWSAKVRLKPGRNKLTATASGPGGASAPAKATVIRR